MLGKDSSSRVRSKKRAVAWPSVFLQGPGETKANSASLCSYLFPIEPSRDQQGGIQAWASESCLHPQQADSVASSLPLRPRPPFDPGLGSFLLPESWGPGHGLHLKSCAAHSRNLGRVIHNHPSSALGETTCRAHPGIELSVTFTRGAGDGRAAAPVPRAPPGSSPVLSGHFPSFCWGPAASTQHLAITGSSPGDSPASHRAWPDGPRALLSFPTQDCQTQSPSCMGTRSLQQLGPLADLLAPSLRLERPGRGPKGGSRLCSWLLPPLQGSGWSLLRVLTEFSAKPWPCDGLRSPVGKPRCPGQYSRAFGCPSPSLGSVG